MRYFIGNWKMYGNPKSLRILHRINIFINKDKNRAKYKVIMAPPFTLLESFAKHFDKKKISISAQNCFYKDGYSSDTGSISAYMIRSIGVKNIIIGHSDNRSEGDDTKKLIKKINSSYENNMNVIFCIGENLKQKKLKKTNLVLKKQLKSVLTRKHKNKKIIVAYEPVWSIGSGLIPQTVELSKTIQFIKKTLTEIFGSKKLPPVLYGGSVDSSNVNQFKKIRQIDGFLVGGASKSEKKFIDIIKNYYR